MSYTPTTFNEQFRECRKWGFCRYSPRKLKKRNNKILLLKFSFRCDIFSDYCTPKNCKEYKKTKGMPSPSELFELFCDRGWD